MWVEYVWPKCGQLGGRTFALPVDVFWVECQPNEVPLILALNRRDTSRPLYAPAPSCHREDPEGVWQYFLVSRDCGYVESTPRLFPFSNGAAGRFKKLEAPVQIQSLLDLAAIEVP